VVDYNDTNPRDQLADLVADMHTNSVERDEQTLDEFMWLRRNHLQGKENWKLGSIAGLGRSFDAPWPMETAGQDMSRLLSTDTKTRTPSSRSSSRRSIVRTSSKGSTVRTSSKGST